MSGLSRQTGIKREGRRLNGNTGKVLQFASPRPVLTLSNGVAQYGWVIWAISCGSSAATDAFEPKTRLPKQRQGANAPGFRI